MTSTEFTDLLAQLIDFAEENGSEDAAEIAVVDYFQRVGLMTENDGLVITMHDGSEFQVTVVRSN